MSATRIMIVTLMLFNLVMVFTLVGFDAAHGLPGYYTAAGYFSGLASAGIVLLLTFGKTDD
jgi:hypothetical protein